MQQATLDPETRLKNIMNGLAESVLELSDEEIMQEVREQGFDPALVAEETRQVMLGALRRQARRS
jgi:hypothetical protein